MSENETVIWRELNGYILFVNNSWITSSSFYAFSLTAFANWHRLVTCVLLFSVWRPLTTFSYAKPLPLTGISFFELGLFYLRLRFSGTQIERERSAGCNIRGIKISNVVATISIDFKGHVLRFRRYYPHLAARSTVYFQFLNRKACFSEMIRRQFWKGLLWCIDT
jgi:hypothetical protein